MTGILTKKGLRADRKLFAGSSNRDSELNDLISTSPTPFMKRAVVVDVIFDPQAQRKELADIFTDRELLTPELLDSIPNDSIIARVVSLGEDRRDQTPAIFYPFHSHVRVPIKPGEHVWVFFENPASSLDQGFWITRIREPSDIDDPNFTHADRKFISDRTPTTLDRLNEIQAFDNLAQDVKERIKRTSGTGPQFPNGGSTEESFTLADVDAYERINDEAIASRVFTPEVVPRYNKRPGDIAFEGSNNSLLVLGEDRTGTSADINQGNIIGKPTGDKSSSAGMFDLVVGRGLNEDGVFPQPGAQPAGTSPNVIQNARGLLENNKTRSAQHNLNEGNPSFENDAARIYGSMDTDVDLNFGKPLPNLEAGNKPVVVNTGPAIIVKTLHNRIIAKKDGTIRIVKEGDEDNEQGTGRAVILIEPDGSIMIDGPKIVLGSGIEKANGKGAQVIIGRDATEPLVMGDELKTLIDAHGANINSNIAAFADAITSGLTPFTAPPGNFGNLGAPVPGLTGGLSAIISAASTLKAQIKVSTDTLQNNTIKFLSKVGKTK